MLLIFLQLLTQDREHNAPTINTFQQMYQTNERYIEHLNQKQISLVNDAFALADVESLWRY